jgi:hypothetical protein
MTDRWWISAAVALLIVAGCSGDDEDSEPSPGVASGGTDGAGATAGTDMGPAGAGGDTTKGSGRGGAGGQSGHASAQAGAGGEAGSASGPAEPLAICGEYADEFDTSYVITATSWTLTYAGSDPLASDITLYDNEEQYVVGRNDSANAFNPNLWSRFDWTQFDTALWVCQSAYDAPSEAAALATARPDDSDPSVDGSCGVGAWSRLSELGSGTAGADGQVGQAGSGGRAGIAGGGA